MSNDNTAVIVIAAGAALYLVMAQKRKAQLAAVASASNGGTKNVQNTLWGSLLGTAWTSLTKPSSSGGSALAGLLQNTFGQTTTTDGKPVGGSWADYLPITMGNGYADVPDTVAGGTDYESKLFDFSDYF